MSTQATTQLSRERIRELTERETAALDERTPGSAAMYERARQSLGDGPRGQRHNVGMHGGKVHQRVIVSGAEMLEDAALPAVVHEVVR